MSTLANLDPNAARTTLTDRIRATHRPPTAHSELLRVNAFGFLRNSLHAAYTAGIVDASCETSLQVASMFQNEVMRNHVDRLS